MTGTEVHAGDPAAPMSGAADSVAHRLLGGNLAELGAASEHAECLVALLQAIGWRGEARHVAEAMPHFAKDFGSQDLRHTLAALKIGLRPARTRLSEIDESQLPCLFRPDGGPLMVVLRRLDLPDSLNSNDTFISTVRRSRFKRFLVHDGQKRCELEYADDGTPGTAHLVSQHGAADTAQTPGSWFGSVARRFRGIIYQMVAISALNSCFALAVPLFIMAVYDQVVGTRSVVALGYLAVGIGLALTLDLGLRVVRARLLAYVAGRLDMSLGSSTFERIMRQPVARVTNTSIGAQLTSLRQFEAVRDFFTGPLAGAFLELPFTLLYIAVIGVLGGWLAAIPLILLVLFLALGAMMNPAIQRSGASMSEARLERQTLVVEMLENMRTIKILGAQDVWRDKYRRASARSVFRAYGAGGVSGMVASLAQMMMFVAGIATVSLGALQALRGDMSLGALVAIMALVWRVLSPIYMTYLSLGALNRIIVAIRQIDRLMQLPIEREADRITETMRDFTGRVELVRAGFRYSPRSDPALIGVSLTAKPGQLVAVVGASGSGKSTLLKLVSALVTPQAGCVLIDGIDVRQLSVGETRHNVVTLAQDDRLFYGTISQNLRMANPTATDMEIYGAIADAGLEEDIARLPEGLETRLTDNVQKRLAKSFAQRLMLARVYVTNAPIYLLDEPGRNLDFEGDRALMSKLERLRGEKTVIYVTHRPSHVKLADVVVQLDSGVIAQIGSPDEVMPKLYGGAAA